MSEKKDTPKQGKTGELVECIHCKNKVPAGDTKKDNEKTVCLTCFYKYYDMCDSCKKIVAKDSIFEDQIDMMDVNRRCKECHETLHVRCIKCNRWGDKESMVDGVCEDCRNPQPA